MQSMMRKYISLFIACSFVTPLGLFSKNSYASLVASILPISRSIEVGDTATVFATIINTGSTLAMDCSVALGQSLDAGLTYQPTDPTTNALTGQPNTPVDIPASQSQSFLLGITPNAAFAPTEVALRYACGNMEPAQSIPGVNTLQLSASEGQTPDVVALAATLENDGVVHLEDNMGTFAVAAVNLGAADDITATTDTGEVELPVTVTLCETVPATGQCIDPPSREVTTNVGTNDTPSFGIFAEASERILLDPAVNRIYVRFLDSGGIVRGATSVALEGGSSPVSKALEVARQIILMMFGDSSQVSSTRSASSKLAAVDDSQTQSVSLTLSCPGGGTISFDGTRTIEQVTNPLGIINTLSGSMEYAGCLGANGVLATWSRGEQYSEDYLSLQVGFDGTLNLEDCSATYTALSVSASGDPRDTTSFFMSPFITNGEIFVVCSEDSALCSFNNVDLLDQDAVESSCVAVQ